MAFTVEDRRAALAAAIVDQGVPVADSWGQRQPPFALIFGDGSDVTPRGGSIAWRFRVTGVLAAVTDQVALSGMDALSWSLILAGWEVAGFTVDNLGPVVVRDLSGAAHYTVDMNVTTTVDF